MPNIVSKELAAKLLGSDWSFGYNCYEVGHTWTPNCTEAALELSAAAGLKILPLYAALYTFSQLAVQRRYDLKATWDTTKSIGRSSFFIFFHAYNGSLMGCALRKGFGRFYYRILVCAPALISSYLSLLIEKPARRQALAFYMLNLASEIVYRMAVTKGHFKPLKHGETLLFAISLGAWYHLIKEHGFGHDPVSAVAKVLIGRAEARSRSTKQTHPSSSDQSSSAHTKVEDQKNKKKEERKPNWFMAYIQQLPNNNNNNIITSWARTHKHPCCPHTEPSCLQYVLGPTPTRFLTGYSIQTLLGLSRDPLKLIQSPGQALKQSLMAKSSLRFGLFLSSLVSGGRLVSCLLRHTTKADDAWQASVAGFVAGLSMFLAPRSSLSMYVMWKAVEQYYLLAARQGIVKCFDFTIMTIYSASAATILYTFALEPSFVRPSYMKFLDNLSDHRLHQLNRMVLDVFGTGSSVGYEDYFPNLDPKHMSNQFKELIFNWMIQPYE